MEAELALHRRLGGLALVKLDHGARELGHIAGGIGPVQVTAVGAGARVLGLLLGDLVKLATFLRLAMMALASSSFSTRMWRARYSLPPLAATNLSYSALMSASVTGCSSGSRQTARGSAWSGGQVQLVLVVVGGVQAALLGFLHEDLAGDDFVLELALHLGVTGRPDLAICCASASARASWERLAIDDGQVLGKGGQGQGAGQGSRSNSGQGFFISGISWESSEHFDREGVHAPVDENLQRIIHKAMLRHAGPAGKQR
jgi:hypothetical protein